MTLPNSTRTFGGVVFNRSANGQCCHCWRCAVSDTVVMAGNITTLGTTGNAKIQGSVDFGANVTRTISVASGTTFIITGNMTAAGSLTVSGGGTADFQGPDNSGVNHVNTGGTAVQVRWRLGAQDRPALPLRSTMAILWVPENSIFVTDFFNSGTITNVSGALIQFPTGFNISSSSRTGLDWSLGATSAFPSIFSGDPIEIDGRVNLFNPSSVQTRSRSTTPRRSLAAGSPRPARRPTRPPADPGRQRHSNVGRRRHLAGATPLGLDVPETVSQLTVKINSPMTHRRQLHDHRHDRRQRNGADWR